MSKGSRLSKLQQNRIKNGRGQGYGADYQPFIQAHDNKVASEGWLTRSKGWKTGRIHHTLSKYEFEFFLYLEWLDHVVDIREQYPLDPIERTQEIAEQLGIKHPHHDGVPVIMTTDFVVTLKTSNGLIDVVRTIKPKSGLDNRTIELFTIEKKFFQEKGIDWCIVLGDTLPSELISNVDWMYEAKYLGDMPGIDEELVSYVAPNIYDLLSLDNGNTAIGTLCQRADKQFRLESGTSMYILQHMLANKRWGTNMNVLIKERKPLQIYDYSCISHNVNIG